MHILNRKAPETHTKVLATALFVTDPNWTQSNVRESVDKQVFTYSYNELRLKTEK